MKYNTNKFNFIAIALFAAFAIQSCTEERGNSYAAKTKVNADGLNFIRTAHEAGLTEIEASKIAKKNSTNSQVTAFADMMIAEQLFITLVGALEQRNIRHESMQRNISVLGAEAALDNATVMILKDMTDSVYGLGDDAVKHLEDVFNRFRNHIRKNFPKSTFLSTEDFRD